MLQTIAKQLGDVQSRCFGAWRGVVASEKKEREAKLQKAARMWKHRGVGAAFRRWQDYRELRRFLRRVMSRAVMGKDARAKKDAYGELREHSVLLVLCATAALIGNRRAYCASP